LTGYNGTKRDRKSVRDVQGETGREEEMYKERQAERKRCIMTGREEDEPGMTGR